MIRLTGSGAMLLALVGTASLARGQATPAGPGAAGGNVLSPDMGRPNQVVGDEITPAQAAAVAKGLEVLAKQQSPDGSWGTAGGAGAPAAVTALSAIALMADGDLPGRGKYGDNVRKAVEFICNSSQESGLLTASGNQGEMYSHGFATLFLGEVYGMTANDEVKEKLQKAVRLIEKSQNPQGGWRYQPAPVDADISVTICQVMALRSARDAGIKVQKDTIDNAIKYVKQCQNPDGGFNYQIGSGGSGFARTAAGTAALYYAGAFQDDSVQRGLKFLIKQLPTPAPQGVQPGMLNQEGNWYYGQYYAVQAMFLAGGNYWKQWYPAIRDTLVKRQDPTGMWSGEVDNDYCTAIALIILQMPNRYLPVFNGKGPGS
jgi:prenyltransferase beta subunit